jgi:hypothetical protein
LRWLQFEGNTIISDEADLLRSELKLLWRNFYGAVANEESDAVKSGKCGAFSAWMWPLPRQQQQLVRLSNTLSKPMKWTKKISAGS